MSYNHKDEIRSKIALEVTTMLGGKKVEEETLEDGSIRRCCSFPFDGYEKGNVYMIRFDCVEDFDKVLNFIEHTDYVKVNGCVCGGRLLAVSRGYGEMRFKL